MNRDGVLCATIDDYQQKELHTLIGNHFGNDNLIGTITIRANPSGRPTQTGFSIAHEYAIFARNQSIGVIQKLERTESQLERYRESDSNGIFEWRNFRREGSNSDRVQRKKLYYPIYIDGQTFRIPSLAWDVNSESWITHNSPKFNETAVYPINEEGHQKTWRWKHDQVMKNASDFTVKNDRNGRPWIYYKSRPNNEGMLPLTIWYDSKYSATEHGTGMIKSLFGKSIFSYPKSVYAVEDCIKISGLRFMDSFCLDFFSGSGTTAHAVLKLNDEDGGKRKFILIEVNDYFDSVLLSRCKKVGFSFNWDKGSPEDAFGPGLFMRVQRLEQYEDTLENLATATGENQNLFSGPEALAYELDAEARHLLLAADHFTAPFGLTLKRIAGADITAGPVDLVESLIYLLGLRVNQLFRQQGSVIITGLLNHTSETAAIFWRDNLLHDADWLQTQMADYPADRYYTNDPARLSFPGIERFGAIETVFIEGMNGNG